MRKPVRLPLCTYIVFLLLVSHFNSYAQSAEDKRKLQELRKEIRNEYDSFYRSSRLKQLSDEVRTIIARSESYGVLNFFYDVSQADINGLNTDFKANGLPAMRNTFHSFGFGFSRKNKKVLTHFLTNLTLSNRVSNADYKVSLYGSGFTLDKGYALFDNGKIILHPFAGLGMQLQVLKVTEKNSLIPVTTLFDIPQDEQKGKLYRNTFHGVLGAQFTYNAGYSKCNNTGIQFALRFAWNPVFARSRYKYQDDNSQYKPDITLRQYNVTLMTNLFFKTTFR